MNFKLPVGVYEKRRLRRAAIGFVIMAIFSFSWNRIPLTRDLERATLDYRYRYFNRHTKASDKLVFIDIDEASLKNLSGSYGRWPWPRHAYKDLLEFLSIGEPAGVFFDILFSEQQKQTNDDEILAQASAAGSTMVSHAMALLQESTEGLNAINPLPADFPQRFSIRFKNGAENRFKSRSELGGQQFPDYALPNPLLYAKTKGLHVVTFEKDTDGISRTARLLYHYGDQWLPSMALAGVLAAIPNSKLGLEGNMLEVESADATVLKLPIYADGTMPLHFYDLNKSPERIGIDVVLASAAELQKGNISDPTQLKVNPLEFKGKVILVGGSAAGLADLKATSISPAYPGTLLGATLISNILEQDFLKELPELASLSIALLVVALCYFVVLFHSQMLVKLSIPLLIVSANLGIAIWLFQNHSLRFDIARPSVLAFFSMMDAFAYVSFIEGAEKKRIRSTLVKFVSPAVAEAMIATGKDPTAEVGRKEELSVLFSDIRGFTTLSERYKPEFLVEWLNEYFAKMTGLVFESEGTIDKFIGDALMAFWGAPIKQDNHAYRAVSSAIGMRRELAELLKDWRVKYKGAVQIDIGIGINSGEVVVGNIGSDRRLEYTVIGDNVNLASRIEGLTKQYGLGLLVSARTKELAGDDFLYRLVDCVQVKGKTSGVMLYEPLCEKRLIEEEETKILTELSGQFEWAWKDYQAGNFSEALRKFEEIQSWRKNDGPCDVYLHRCQELVKSPPKDWDGIYVAKSK